MWLNTYMSHKIITAVTTTNLSHYMPNGKGALPHIVLTAWCGYFIDKDKWSYARMPSSPRDLVFFTFEEEMDYFTFLLNWQSIFKIVRVSSIRYPLDIFSENDVNDEDSLNS